MFCKFKELKKHYKKTSGIKFALIGSDLSQSLSPHLHNNFLKKTGQPTTYIAVNVELDEIEEALAFFYKHEFIGINITSPFKQTILNYIEQKSSLVQSISSANTLIFDPATYLADSTDGLGFLKSLENFTIQGKEFLILGAGGASRAVIHILLAQDAKRITVMNRSWEHLSNLHNQFKAIKIIKWGDALEFNKIDAFIQCTNYIDKNSLPFDLRDFKKDFLFYDLNYQKTNNTPLNEAKKLGIRTQDGLKMLQAQAAASMSLWLKKPIETIYPYYNL